MPGVEPETSEPYHQAVAPYLVHLIVFLDSEDCASPEQCCNSDSISLEDAGQCHFVRGAGDLQAVYSQLPY